MRMPISRVRSVTLTSMMFMMPMPPTSRETQRDAGQQDAHGAGGVVGGVGDFLLGADGEIIVVVAGDAVPLAEQVGDLLLDGAQGVRR